MNIHERIIETEAILNESLEEEGKKGSGSYYTPDFIVEYMVQTTISQTLVDKINEQQNHARFENLKDLIHCTDNLVLSILFEKVLSDFVVCDIAMGWGVFLLHTFDFLYSFYVSFASFIENNLLSKSQNEQSVEEWIVDRILNIHIFGVDLSPISVKLAELKLIEKALIYLEKESTTLPKLSLRDGNSLLDTHIFTKLSQNQSKPLYFDVILGNPPYINVKKLSLDDRKLYSQLYRTYNPNGDISNIFWEKSIEMCKKNGRISLITPRYWLEGNDSDKLRSYLLSNTSIKEIIDFRSNRTLFLSTENVLGVDTAIISVMKYRNPDQEISVLISLDNKRMSLIEQKNFRIIKFEQKLLSKTKWSFEKNAIIERLEDNSDFRLGDDKKNKEFNGICLIGKGCSTGNNKIFRLKKLNNRVFEGYNKIRIELDKNELTALRLLIKNSDISRYRWGSKQNYWIYLRNKEIDNYPRIQNYLSNFRERLEQTKLKYGLDNYYDYAAYRSLRLIDHSPKIICPYQATENRFALFSEDQLLTINEADVITLVVKEGYRQQVGWMYLLAVLNSELIQYYSMINNKKIYNLYDFRTNQIASFPIMTCKKQLSFNVLVRSAIEFLSTYKKEHSQQALSLLSIINALVYELYFEDFLSTELNEKIIQSITSFNFEGSVSLNESRVRNSLDDLLTNEHIIKDMRKITDLKQVKNIRKFINR